MLENFKFMQAHRALGHGKGDSGERYAHILAPNNNVKKCEGTNIEPDNDFSDGYEVFGYKYSMVPDIFQIAATFSPSVI